MPEVTIHWRRPSRSFGPVREEEITVQVLYSTPAIPPRFVLLPQSNYRPATPDELRANPDYELLPKDQAAITAERLAIQQNIASRQAAPLESFPL